MYEHDTNTDERDQVSDIQYNEIIINVIKKNVKALN